MFCACVKDSLIFVTNKEKLSKSICSKMLSIILIVNLNIFVCAKENVLNKYLYKHVIENIYIFLDYDSFTFDCLCICVRALRSIKPKVFFEQFRSRVFIHFFLHNLIIVCQNRHLSLQKISQFITFIERRVQDTTKILVQLKFSSSITVIFYANSVRSK